jgi:apolipoprotein N-acyltransferase
MRHNAWKHWGAAGLAAGLLELPFPLAGPLSPWRSVFAWFGLVPLLWAILSPATLAAPRPLRRAFLLSYLTGFLWYMGNCYWVRDTMSRYGDMPPLAPTLLLIAFSLVLGLYFAFFGLGVVLFRKATGSLGLALVAAPFLWTALDLAAARITSVPWDQLGYSQVDNALVNQLAPWTGVYGITFLLVAANALLAGALITGEGFERPGARRRGHSRMWLGLCAAVLLAVGFSGLLLQPSRPAGTSTAVLVQPNLDVGSDSNWTGPGEWEGHIAEFTRLAGEQCKPYIAGIPQTNAPTGEIVCPPYPTHPDLVAWPEAPAPFVEADPRFHQSAATLAHTIGAPLVIGGIGVEYSDAEGTSRDFNSAMIFGPDGSRQGRYDKIHLVPFGEYIPFKNLLVFARKLTGRVSEFSRGAERNVFLLPTRNGARHRYGFFICYEAVFADEVRYFARNGAEALVNISDDGWYGDTSAPWQHLNMARMRAIENRRWLLRDTNSGITAAIDPWGRVRQSIPRHKTDALPAQYGFRDDITFYTAHGDVFAWCCAILSIGVAVWSVNRLSRSTADAKVHIKVRS